MRKGGHVIAGSRGAKLPGEAPRAHFVEVAVLGGEHNGLRVGTYPVAARREWSRARIIATACDEARRARGLKAGTSLTGRLITPAVSS